MIKGQLLLVTDIFKPIQRFAQTKPWRVGPKEYWNQGIPNYDWRRARGKKVTMPKGFLTAVEKMKKQTYLDLSPEERRSLYKEKGIAPPRTWMEETMFVAASGLIMEPYVPPEGDGKASLLSIERSKQESKRLTSKGKSYMALKKIRNYLEYFDPTSFGPEALEIYLKAHQCLVDREQEKIFDYVTEKCYPEMTRHCDCKTLRWNYIQSIEPPVVVHVRYIDGKEVGSQYGQVTVRIHSQQTLAVYDQFGRLVHGDEAVVKNVLEYVVFENQLSNIYGKWRVHGKIIPEWMPPRESIAKTFVKPDIPPKQDFANPTKDEESSEVEEKKDGPVLAAA